MDYNVRLLHFECNCGWKPNWVKVAITSNAELMAEWTCPTCKKNVRALIPFQDLIRDIPNSPHTPVTLTEKDVAFMKGLHIEASLD